jgi:uncharacterized protein YndB with AHSA1/START domain
MSHNERTIATSPDRVWDVLADGWLYPLWVVGASRVRAVDAHWPDVGARIHHSVGVWPGLIDDETKVLERDGQRFLKLVARGWPMGEAEVRITLEAAGAGTRVVIEEDAVSGPGKLVPKPLRQPPLLWRNTETLRRLAYVAEGRPD